jgi:DNA-binding LytR/AlgR family response regulator
MNPYSCLILEDEPIAVEILTDYIDQIPFLKLAGTCRHAMEASGFLRKQPVDVLFLDLHLPKMKGFDFLKTLPQTPQVIVTTAYHEYALEGYEHHVVDYLLKPIDFDRFVKAVHKLKSPDASQKTSVSQQVVEVPLSFTYQKRNIRLRPSEIDWVESQRDYCFFHLGDRTVKVKVPLQGVAAQLSDHTFLRIHRSFLIRLDRLDAWSATEVEINGESLPIGSTYRQQVLSRLKGT